MFQFYFPFTKKKKRMRCEREGIVGQLQWSLKEARRGKEPTGTD